MDHANWLAASRDVKIRNRPLRSRESRRNFFRESRGKSDCGVARLGAVAHQCPNGSGSRAIEDSHGLGMRIPTGDQEFSVFFFFCNLMD